MSTPRYVIITPVRNEQDHVGKTIESVVSQTIRPVRWIIVNDGSTDATGEIIDQAAAAHEWVRAVHRPDRGARKSGGGVIEAFYDGFALVENSVLRPSHSAFSGQRSVVSGQRSGVRGQRTGVRGQRTAVRGQRTAVSGQRTADSGQRSAVSGQRTAVSGQRSAVSGQPAWDFLVKLDGDLSFEPDYFEKCFERFTRDPKLGIGGGAVWSHVEGRWINDGQYDPKFHVRGATKIYRRACWEAIGGLIPSTGWDTLDEVKANMLGWTTRSFPELRIHQLKPTGRADGIWRNWFKNGRANYIVGYHPLFMLAKCARRFFRPPYGIASLALWSGFVSGYLRGVAQASEPELIRYLRRQQMNRLLWGDSLWQT